MTNLLESHERPFIPHNLPRKGYQRIHVCDHCQLHTQAAIGVQQPCRRCGNLSARTIIAKWVRTNPTWQFWKEIGVWEESKAPSPKAPPRPGRRV